MRSPLLLAFLILCASSQGPCGGEPATAAVSPVDPARLRSAIGRGVGFLETNQMKHGEFRTYASPDSTLARIRHFDSSPFVTSFVAYSLSYIADPRVEEMTARALCFLAEEMDREGTWRYWSSLNDKAIDPDLDDTACISFLLRRHRKTVPANHEVFYGNTDSRGRFKTWLRKAGSSTPNDVDCVVNANVLLYLGSNARTQAACAWVNNVIARGTEASSTVYYVHDTAFYYMLSRAFLHGANCLGASRDAVLSRLGDMQGHDGAMGDELATGFGICARLNFGVDPDSAMAGAATYLLRRQRPDGSWPISAFYVARRDGVWWGSEELTTAVCLEALSRYLSAVGGGE
ncbi:hypothetical protein JXA88_08865 [Candidatus Fermentibacteria bacterium]|nr:hypothetical protein [Candidatus Fermentibacteria bacterium]